MCCFMDFKNLKWYSCTIKWWNTLMFLLMHQFPIYVFYLDFKMCGECNKFNFKYISPFRSFWTLQWLINHRFSNSYVSSPMKISSVAYGNCECKCQGTSWCLCTLFKIIILNIYEHCLHISLQCFWCTFFLNIQHKIGLFA